MVLRSDVEHLLRAGKALSLDPHQADMPELFMA